MRILVVFKDFLRVKIGFPPICTLRKSLNTTRIRIFHMTKIRVYESGSYSILYWFMSAKVTKKRNPGAYNTTKHYNSHNTKQTGHEQSGQRRLRDVLFINTIIPTLTANKTWVKQTTTGAHDVILTITPPLTQTKQFMDKADKTTGAYDVLQYHIHILTDTPILTTNRTTHYRGVLRIHYTRYNLP